ncbi:MAG: tyrosine-type recombinase/integrase, partial [Bacteroidota bacterium]
MYQNKFLEYLSVERHASQHTIIAYTNDLQQFTDFMAADYEQTNLALVEGKQVRAWIVHLLNNDKTPRTVRRKLATLKSFYRYLRSRAIIDKDPMLKVIAPKMGKRLPNFVQEDKMNVLLDEIDFPNTYSGHRNRLILELFYMTGMRRSELIQLQEKNIDYANAILKISGKGGKQRILPLTKDLPERLRQFSVLKKETFPKSDHPELFYTDKGKPLYPKLVYNIVHRYLSQVTTIEQRSPHTIRHS